MQSRLESGTYYAPRPNLSLIDSQSSFSSSIRSVLGALAGNWLSNKISQLILASQKMQPDAFDLNIYANDTIKIDQFSVVTHDQVSLDTVMFSHKRENDCQGLVVIYLPGAAVLYQNDPALYIEMAKKFNCSVVSFNYRGTGFSSGAPKTEDDLVTDCIAQVNCLLDRGVAAESIVLYSPSLGGAIGAKVAHYFHKQDHKLYYLNLKSFSSMPNVITGLLRTLGKSGHYEYPAMQLLSYIIKPVLKFVLWLAGWSMEALHHYNALPAQHKGVFVVRSDKTRRLKYGKNLRDDQLITHYASMYAALKYSGKKTSEVQKMSAKNIGDNGHDYQCKLEDRDGRDFDRCLFDFFNTMNKETGLVEEETMAISSRNSG